MCEFIKNVKIKERKLLPFSYMQVLYELKGKYISSFLKFPILLSKVGIRGYLWDWSIEVRGYIM